MKRKFFGKISEIPWLSIFLLIIYALAGYAVAKDSDKALINKLLGIPEKRILAKIPDIRIPTLTPTPIIIPKPTITYVYQGSTSTNYSGNNTPWGVAQQISGHTYTMKVGEDSQMATPKEIQDALNHYRQVHGAGYLAWDDNLGNYAQQRAGYFNSIGKLDEHAGFEDFLNNQDGYKKLNFYHVGENSSIGYVLSGTHLIEWIYAGDKPHNDNQLNPSWTHVGIGVSGTATDLIFAE